MNRNSLLLAAGISVALFGCSSGDINIEPSTSLTNSNNTTNNTTGTAADPNEVCASYQNSGGQTITGSFDGTNCRYTPAFVDAGNNLTTDLTIPALENGGAHIFEGSLFVGETFDNNADLAAAGIQEGGDGPVLTIEAGATLAWESSEDFLIINRGSQIFAVGREDAPITFTSTSDVNGTLPTFDAVQQWGGMVINGFGITNKCAYTANAMTGALETDDCHVDAEGALGLDESQYGGDNNEDSSGRLEYVIVKHTGATVGSGDELNGISFGGVGSNTIVDHLQVYSTFDDGIEMFGGALDISNFVALYVRDDSIDIDEGYSGNITNALVVQSANIGNHCIEADGIGSFDSFGAAEIEAFIDQGINSRTNITNLTCIISPSVTQGDFDPGTGWRLREGIFANISDSMVITSFGVDSADSNYCVRIDNRSLQAAEDGDLTITNTIFACEEPTREGSSNTLPGGRTTLQFLQDSGNVFATITGQTNATAAADPDLQLLEGTPPIYSIDVATSAVDGAAPMITPANGTYIGGLSLGDVDWATGWAFGLVDGNRDEPLWFE